MSQLGFPEKSIGSPDPLLIIGSPDTIHTSLTPVHSWEGGRSPYTVSSSSHVLTL